MATSTFFDQIVIDDKAADIIIAGLNGPKPPRPKSMEAEIKRGEMLLQQYRQRLEAQSDNQKKPQ
jgi:hypothetical protein